MSVTANFVPEHITLLPNVTTTATLRLYSDDPDTRALTLLASGDFSERVRLESSTVTIETNQIVDVEVTVFAPSIVEPGSYTITVEVGPPAVDVGSRAILARPAAVASDQQPQSDRPQTSHHTDLLAEPLAVATATMEVVAHSDYTVALQPVRSRGSRQGRHVLRVANSGNVAVTLDVAAEPVENELRVEVGSAALSLAPGAANDIPVFVTQATTYWSGPLKDHDFTVRATSADGRADELVGTFQQRPQLPNWVGPAAAGAFAALLIGAIAWFALLRPWVEETADEAAAEAIEQDRAALRERIDELEAAAAEAQELPLGAPIDFRLEVAPASGNSEQDAAIVPAGTIVSITDVVFQNPTGAVGTVSLRRGEEVLLQSELANFRDFDLHFVAPYQFGDVVDIVLDVECRTPGTDASTCPVAASLVGFVDEVD